MSFRFGDSRLPERFWDKVEPEPNSGCWLWTGSLKTGGYGGFTHSRIRWQAHRFTYVMLVGPIQKPLDLDHLCRVRCCVNPAHLEQVTRRENLLRGETLIAKNASKDCCPKGHAYDRLVTRSDGSVGRACRACSKETDRKYRQNNAARIAARKLAYARTNRDEINAYHRAYYQRHKEMA